MIFLRMKPFLGYFTFVNLAILLLLQLRFFTTCNLEGRMDAARSNRLNLDRSFLGTLHRRIYFFVQYIHARARSKAVTRLLPVFEKSFEHPWVVEVELRIKFLPGLEGAWLWQNNPQRSMHWDAPITLSVIRKKRGKKRVAFC